MAAVFLYFAVFVFGGAGYGVLELIFRGHTHWTMLIAGGLCSVFLYGIADLSREPRWKKCIMGGIIITTIEFITGILVNITLGWNVWSYAHRPLNLLGQICPLFSALWVLLSIPAIGICTRISRRVNNR